MVGAIIFRKFMEIRRYIPGEEEAIWDVLFKAMRETNARDYHPDLIERWAPQDKDMDEWRTRIEGKNPFVVVTGGGIVGFAELERCGYIDCFYVHPEWQGKGVGKALIRGWKRRRAAQGKRN